LQFSFELLAQDTPAAGAHVRIEPVHLRIRRANCHVESESVGLGAASATT
jgi:Zn finger protein HypA/HybF involved in hydrogenase expression